VYGEQRGAVLCDFDGDGRVDLAVNQNGAEIKLYQNVPGKPGLRVRLNRPPGNLDADLGPLTRWQNQHQQPPGGSQGNHRGHRRRGEVEPNRGAFPRAEKTRGQAARAPIFS
jgi:hypothetical protein